MLGLCLLAPRVKGVKEPPVVKEHGDLIALGLPSVAPLGLERC